MKVLIAGPDGRAWWFARRTLVVNCCRCSPSRAPWPPALNRPWPLGPLRC